MAPLISIVLPCYKSEQFIADMIRDVRAQTIEDWELLVIGNGEGQEAQRELVKRFAEKDSRIAYYSLKDAGVSRARNYGISQAKGEWMAFIDADDHVPDDWLARYIACVEKSPDIIMGGLCYREAGSASFVNYNFKFENNANVLFSDDAVSFLKLYLENLDLSNSVCNRMFRADFLKEFNLSFDNDLTMGEDCTFNYECVLKSKSICFMLQTGYEYCLRLGKSTVSRYHKTLRCAIEQQRMMLLKVMSMAKYTDIEEERMLVRVMEKAFFHLFLNLYYPGSPFGFTEKCSFVERIFAENKQIGAWQNNRPTFKNLPLFIYWLCYQLYSARLSVVIFSVLYWSRDCLRKLFK